MVCFVGSAQPRRALLKLFSFLSHAMRMGEKERSSLFFWPRVQSAEHRSFLSATRKNAPSTRRREEKNIFDFPLGQSAPIGIAFYFYLTAKRLLRRTLKKMTSKL
jgi:hypothetical protein